MHCKIIFIFNLHSLHKMFNFVSMFFMYNLNFITMLKELVLSNGTFAIKGTLATKKVTSKNGRVSNVAARIGSSFGGEVVTDEKTGKTYSVKLYIGEYQPKSSDNSRI